MPRYHEMIRLTEAVVHQVARDPKLTFASLSVPSLPPMPEGKGRDDGDRTGIIKTVAESQAEFKTAPGYEVSLFASEAEFPELRNPVQIAFDARGRLWVVTMPSFPHTVPGLTPPDKIIILEDTNNDGKADKLTPFVEGLDALDGIAFHHDGVIISEQPRLWLMQDTDGDDRADTKRELLRGIDVTDSHHGGMIQADPLGAIIFSDGVFHRSQLETPFGVHRGMDATTYRRVQVEVVDAVAHLRPTGVGLDTVLASLVPKDETVTKSLAYLDLGVKPVKGRSVPVLEVAQDSQLTQWLWLGEDGDSTAVEYPYSAGKLPGSGLFRTFIQSDRAQPAIIAINHKNLDIRLNDSVVFIQDSLWSGDQQVNVELTPGVNVIEIHLKKGRGKGGSMPPVFLYDPVGQALAGPKYLRDLDGLRAIAAQHDKVLAERGNMIHIQAAAGLQFAPKELRVTPGSKVRLVFSNPDIMMHNWVLLTPGSVEEVGGLADQLAAQADGMAEGYLPTSDKILQATKLLGPNAKEEIVFDAPKQPGDYPYICTFPGHWRIMKGVLIVAERKAPTIPQVTDKPKAKRESKRASKSVSSDGVVIETADSPDAFKTLKPVATPGAKLTTNKKTNNDPIATLTDGALVNGFGPIFGNGTTDGAYKMDLGAPKPVSAVSSWSFNSGGRRGAQKLTIYGSNAEADPGWDLTQWTKLGSIDTTSAAKADFTAASLRTKEGKPLGSFRWIVWAVLPVTNAGGGENTAFQELAVEIQSNP